MSAAAIYNVGIKITAQNSSQGAFSAVGRNISGVTNKLGSLQRRMSMIGRDAQQVGLALTAGITAPVGLAARGIVDTMRHYEGASAQLAATMGRDVDQIGKLQKQAENLASKTVFSEAQIIGAQRESAMAGFTEPQILKATPQVLNLATMSGMEIPQAAQMTTDVLRGMGKDVADLPRLLDLVAFASTKANQDTEQFLRGLTRFGPIARQMNMSAAESIAYLSELADSGFKAGEGGNALRTIMLRLSAPTKAAREAIAGLGLDLTQFGSGGANAAGVISAMVQAGVAGADELERLKPRIAEALTIEPPQGMTREQLIGDLLMTGLDLDGADGSAMSAALGDYLTRAVAGLDHKGLMASISKAIEAKGLDPLPFVNAIFGKQRAAQGAALLAGVDSITQRVEQIQQQSQGAAGKMAATMMESIDNQLKLVTSAKEVFQRKVWDAGFGEAFEALTNRVTNLLLAMSELPPALLNSAAKFAGLAAVVGPATMALGVFIRLTGFALAPLGAMASMMAAATVRTIALGASLVSLKGLRLLLSPIGLAGIALGGLAASMAGAVSVSPIVGKSITALGQNFTDMWAAITEGDGDKLNLAMGNAGRSLRILRFELKQVVQEWMNTTPAGQRFADIWGSITSIGNSVGNSIRNVTGAVSGLVDGIAAGLGWTDDLGASVGEVSKGTQGFVAWFLRAVGALIKVDDQSASITETFKALGEQIGKLVDLVLNPFANALSGLQTLLDDIATSAGWQRIESFFGLETGDTVTAINDVTASLKSLLNTTLALGLASGVLFGFGRTLRGLRGALGMAAGAAGIAAKGGKAAGTVGAAGKAVVGAGAVGAAAATAGAGAGKGAIFAKLAKWAPGISAAMAGLTIYDKEQRDAARRLELIGQGMTPEAAGAQVMRETHDDFNESAVGRLLERIGTPFDNLSRKVNAWMGFADGEGLVNLFTGRTPPVLPPETQANMQAVNNAHDITQQPKVRLALQQSGHIPAMGAAGLLSGLKERAEAARAGLQAPEAATGLALPTAGFTPLPQTFEQAGMEARDTRIESAIKDVRSLLAEGAVKAEVNTEGRVDLMIRTAPGVTATGVTSSTGDIPMRLNAGTSKLAVR